MKKLACSLLVILFIASGILFLGNVHASSYVGGLITTNNTWGIANSPYQLTGPVGVLSGVTLTIEPGVTVDFATFYLQVNGTLNARGTIDNNIVFTSIGRWSTSSQQIEFMPSSTSWNNQANSGSIIENAVFNTTTVTIQDSSPKITNNIFNQPSAAAISNQGGSPSILNNTINCGNYYAASISATGSAVISNNLINSTGYINGISAGENAYVSNNALYGCWLGIIVSGRVTLDGNLIENCYNAGISSQSDQVTIQHNYISNNRFGINGGATIESNTIINNVVGIQAPSASTIIKNNNILNNTQNSIVMSSSSNIDAINNWWGTTDTQNINQTIHDLKNDYNVGAVNFIPFLGQPSSTAPSTPNIDLGPASTPAPTSSTQETTPILTVTNMPTQGSQPTDFSSPNSLGAISGSSSPDDPLAHLNFTEVIEIMLIIVGIAWVVGILAYVNKRSQKNGVKRTKRRKPIKQKPGKLIEGMK
jgi:hypothetical protein